MINFGLVMGDIGLGWGDPLLKDGWMPGLKEPPAMTEWPSAGTTISSWRMIYNRFNNIGKAIPGSVLTIMSCAALPEPTRHYRTTKSYPPLCKL